MWGRGGGHREREPAVRPAAVAGRFYEGRADRLRDEVDGYLADARQGNGRSPAVSAPAPPAGHRLAALVVPHAGHIYSGPVAAFAYAQIDPAAVDRVVLLGPAHYVPIAGIGLSSAGAWRTPLGGVPLDGEVCTRLAARFDDVVQGDRAHAPEHSLEVQLPFLQRVLGLTGWTLVPLIVGIDTPRAIGALIRDCAHQPRTLVIVSTDLSHYLGQDAARARDDRTIAAILSSSPAGIGPEDACGRYPLRGLLSVAPELGWIPQLLDARTSGEVTGSLDRVVGYAAFALWASAEPDPPHPGESGHTFAPEPQSAAGPASGPSGAQGASPQRLAAPERTALLGLARDTIAEALATGRRPSFDAPAWAAAVGLPGLLAPGGAFVTLRDGAGELLGCIGTLAAHQPLAADVAERAYDAAFRDPRFPPLTTQGFERMAISISVPSEPVDLPVASYDELLGGLAAGTGLIVVAGGHRATFLPSVWEQLPTPAAFLEALWRKAGLAPGAWPAGTRIETYGSEEFAEGSAYFAG